MNSTEFFRLAMDFRKCLLFNLNDLFFNFLSENSEVSNIRWLNPYIRCCDFKFVDKDNFQRSSNQNPEFGFKLSSFMNGFDENILLYLLGPKTIIVGRNKDSVIFYNESQWVRSSKRKITHYFLDTTDYQQKTTTLCGKLLEPAIYQPISECTKCKHCLKELKLYGIENNTR